MKIETNLNVVDLDETRRFLDEEYDRLKLRIKRLVTFLILDLILIATIATILALWS